MNKEIFGLLKAMAHKIAEDAIKSNKDDPELKFRSLVILIDGVMDDIRQKSINEELTDVQKVSLADTMSRFLNDSKAIMQISVEL